MVINENLRNNNRRLAMLDFHYYYYIKSNKIYFIFFFNLAFLHEVRTKCFWCDYNKQ
jgi:hypothetical protein